MSQITNRIMMIRPARFGFNEETAANNSFQQGDSDDSASEVQKQAQHEFDAMVSILRDHGVDVMVIEDTAQPEKPDAVFPNNWISLHENGAVITYPMFAENRRIERREDIIDRLSDDFNVKKRYSFEFYEEESLFLEGTGSMIFDREHQIVYACISKRTDPTLIDKFCVLMGCKHVLFHSVDRDGEPIYHTNVMMAVGNTFAVISLETVKDEEERKKIIQSFESTNKEIIEISLEQVEQFAGNMLQVQGDEPLLVMSQSAYNSLNSKQITTLEKHTKILSVAIPTIEYNGGGSVRCMMAENFLPAK